KLRERIAPPSGLAYLAALGAFGAVVVVALSLAVVALRRLVGPAGAPSHDVIPPWMAAMIGVNFAHYWLDSRIWRRPRAPQLAAGTLSVRQIESGRELAQALEQIGCDREAGR